MPSHDNKGRSKYSRHIRIDHWILRSKAWKSLKPREVTIFLLLLQRYNGSNNGEISLSIREAARDGHMSQGGASSAIKNLIELGFIKCRFKGSFSQKAQLASEYELTHVRYGNRSPTKEFMSWKDENITVPIQAHNGIDLGAMSNSDVV